MAEGGHMVIARSLVEALRAAGHQADIIVTPQNRFGRQGAAYLANWLTDVGKTNAGPIDQVISLRYPAYAVRHPRHVCWLNHTMREYYDLWESFSSRLSPQGRLKESVRRTAIHLADRYCLTRHVKRLFTISRTVQDRLRIWPELSSTVLHPPAPQRAYRCDQYGSYIFMVSRLTPLKRADLVIRAAATPAGTGLNVVIAGDGEDAERLSTLARELGVSSRVTLVGPLTDAQLLDHLARCGAVCFPPRDEDYGFVTVEAFASGKAVITCRDSGGPVELIEHGVNGIVCEPTPEALAEAMRDVMADRSRAETMGAAGRQTAARMTWADAVTKLTGVD